MYFYLTGNFATRVLAATITLVASISQHFHPYTFYSYIHTAQHSLSGVVSFNESDMAACALMCRSLTLYPGEHTQHTHILLNESGPARRLSDDVKYDTTLPQQTRAQQRTFCVHESNGTLRNCLPNAKLSSRRRWWRSRL